MRLRTRWAGVGSAGIPLTALVPHPTTLVKLMCRGGAQTVEQLNAAGLHTVPCRLVIREST